MRRAGLGAHQRVFIDVGLLKPSVDLRSADAGTGVALSLECGGICSMKCTRLVSSLFISFSILILSGCENGGISVPTDVSAKGGDVPPVAEVTPTPNPEEPVCEIWEIGTAQGRICSDGSFDVYSSLDLVSAITWNPEVRIPDSLELKWRIRFELPSRG